MLKEGANVGLDQRAPRRPRARLSRCPWGIAGFFPLDTALRCVGYSDSTLRYRFHHAGVRPARSFPTARGS
jgi:hypothetical protein